MRWVAFMPLRANSRSIPNKNLRSIAGRPLYAWSLEQAVLSECFDDIYVSTDSETIRESVNTEFPGLVTVIDRSNESSTDTASTEIAMLEFHEKVKFDVICLIQATSPLTTASDFIGAKKYFLDKNLDSLVTVVESKRFFWTSDAQPVNYDPQKRPRRQEFEGFFMENGAFYLTRSAVLSEQGSRLGGEIGIYEMRPETAIEIDEPADWRLMEYLLTERKASAVRAATNDIFAFVIDVDGTLTDGGMYYGPQGEALKKFNTRDAHGLQRLQDNGVRICIITSEESPSTDTRMEKLGFKDYYRGIKDKFTLLDSLSDQWGISWENIAYMGDDAGDRDCIIHAGISFCPADAAGEIKRETDYVCSCVGGCGAVREVCDIIMSKISGE